jgi:hypothetical protein
MPSDLIHVLHFLVHLGTIVNSCIGVLLRSAGTIGTVYLSSLCIVLLMCNTFTARLLVWCSNFLKFLKFHFLYHWPLLWFGDLREPCGSLSTKVQSERIRQSWIEDAGEFRCWNWMLCPIAKCHKTRWGLSIGVCILLIALVVFRVASAFVSLLGWAVFFWVWYALPISVEPCLLSRLLSESPLPYLPLPLKFSS